MSKYAVENDREYEMWGRKCRVNLVFDCYLGEEIDAVQEEAIDDFETNIEQYTLCGLKAIKNYIVENYKNNIDDATIPNIFKYAVPKTVYVSKDPSKKKVIGIICHFRFDDDSGLAVKFVDGQVVEIGGEQIILWIYHMQRNLEEMYYGLSDRDSVEYYYS